MTPRERVKALIVLEKLGYIPIVDLNPKTHSDESIEEMLDEAFFEKVKHASILTKGEYLDTSS